MGRAKVSVKAILVLTMLIAVGLPLSVEGGRELKEENDNNHLTGQGGEREKAEGEAVHPENFFGGMGGVAGIVPVPGGIPVPGGTGAGFGTAPGVGSSVDFCSVPGLGCVRVQPTNPGGGAIGGGVGSNTPLPFP